MSFSAFFALNQEIADTIQSIVRFYLPSGGVIYDPTCGKVNHQFSSWIEQMTLAGVKYDYVSSDIKPFGDIQADLWHLPFKGKFADLSVLDVPFTPQGKDRRSEDYDIMQERNIDDIRDLFSAEILNELARVTKSFIVVRGQDFYWPANTCNLYSFCELALEQIKGTSLRLRAFYPFRYNYHRLSLIRENCKNIIRPIITHGYAVVLATPEAPERRDGAAIKEIVMAQNWGKKTPTRREHPLRLV